MKTFEIYKKKKLDEFDELVSVKLSNIFKDDKAKESNQREPTMVENIINNLHIDIKKIVLIFDDCVSDPKHPYSFGVTLNRLYIDSTTKDFTKGKDMDPKSPLKYKLFSIESLNFFLDKINEKDIIKEENGDIVANHKMLDSKKNAISEEEKTYLKDSLDFYLYCQSEIDEYSKDKEFHNYLLRELNFTLKLMNMKLIKMSHNFQL